MVSALLRILNKEFGKISEAALLLAVFTFGSQILGLVRDRLLAGNIGPGPILDVYNTAFKIPDLIFALSASLVSVTILIPYVVERLESKGKDNARKFLSQIFSVFFVLIIAVSIIVFFAMPLIAPILAPGFDAGMLQDLIKTARVMLLSPVLLGLSSLFGVVTQTYKRFMVYALAPVLYNAGLIIGVGVLYKNLGLTGLAVGVVLGALFHFLVQLPVTIKEEMLPKFTTNINWKSIRNVAAVSLPRTFALATQQILFTVLISIASTMAAGSISIFQFAYVLQSVPYNLIGLSYSVAAFPSLVRFYAQGQHEKFVSTVLNPMKNIIFWSIPIMFLFVVLRAQIVRVVLGTGQFDWTDTTLTAAALALFVLSIAAQGVIALIVRAYYAAGITYRPLIHNLISAGLVIGLALWLNSGVLQAPETVEWIRSTMRLAKDAPVEVLILPFAYSIGLLVNALILWTSFAIKFRIKAELVFFRLLSESLIGSAVLGFVTYQSLKLFGELFDISTFFGIFLQGFFSGILGIVSGIVVLLAIKNKETYQLINAIRSKFWKSEVIVDSSSPSGSI